MRNLKRALSLTLASVMLLGMMVLGTSAASYPDVTDEHNVEAIEVLQAVGAMSGSNSGNFNPDGKVTRIEMAIVMANLLDLDVNYFQGQNTFSDVPEWASGYVNACAANGIVTGVGGGRFGTGNVTATQAALMMLKALGYFQYNSDFGSDWARATANQAARIRLFDGIDVRDNTQLTRNQVAKLALNALESTVVEADDDTLSITTPDGVTVAGGNVKYVVLASTQSFAQAIDDTEYNAGDLAGRGGCTVELGEQLYNGDLKLRDYDADDFERPARNWEYKGQEIGSYMKKGNIRAEYTTGVSARTLYDLIGRANLVDPNYTFNSYVDGKVDNTVITPNTILARTTKDFSTTGKGVLTQVFVDTEKKTIDISSINTWLAKATTDYSSSRESVTLEVYTEYKVDTDPITSAQTPRTIKQTETVSLEDATGIEDIKKDDMVLVQRSYKGVTGSNPVTKVVARPEVLSDATISEYSRDETNDQDDRHIFTKVTVDEKKYDGSKKAAWNADVLDRYNQNLLTDKTYDVYLDKYGYAIGVDLHSGTDNYVFITGADLNGSAIANTTAKANAIFLDGTVSAIDVNVKDTNKNIANVAPGGGDESIASAASYFHQWNGNDGYFVDGSNAKINRWFTYTVNSNNVYTLTPATRQFTTDVQSDLTIKCNNASLTENDVDTVSVTSGDPPTTTNVKTSWQPTVTTAQRAFGNDKSVYLIADLDTVSAGSNKKVITGVKNLYTGVQSVEIEVKTHDDGQPLYQGTNDETTLYDSVYTVYDKDLYIIGSVIIGDSKGSSSNYAYILSAATGEGKRGENYYWTFDAVVDGAKKTLTVESKFANAINPLKPGNMMELRYNGDYVSDVRPIEDSKFYKNMDKSNPLDPDDVSVWDVGHNHTVANKEHNGDGCANIGVFGSESRLTNANLVLQGRTLRIGAQTNEPMLLVSTETPAFVIQREGDVSDSSTWKTTKEGYSSVDQAIGEMEDSDQSVGADGMQFTGRIVAALDSRGLAKWVVFISDTVKPITSGGNRPDAPVAEGTITVRLQYKDESNADIVPAQSYEKLKSGDTIDIVVPNGYVCTSNPNLKYTVPTLPANQTEWSDVVRFATLTPGAVQTDDAPEAGVNWSGVTPPADETAKESYGVDQVKALDDGAYTMDPSFDPDNTKPNDNPLYFDKTAVKPEDNKIFKYTSTSNTTKYILIIDNEATYREESAEFSAAGDHFFFVQVTKSLTGFHNFGTGTMATRPLSAGIHSYRIIEKTSGDIIQAGTFEI